MEEAHACSCWQHLSAGRLLSGWQHAAPVHSLLTASTHLSLSIQRLSFFPHISPGLGLSSTRALLCRFSRVDVSESIEPGRMFLYFVNLIEHSCPNLPFRHSSRTCSRANQILLGCRNRTMYPGTKYPSTHIPTYVVSTQYLIVVDVMSSSPSR